jgi:hypothetical protein
MMLPTTCAAYLRVYQPLGSFAPRERGRWVEYLETGRALPPDVLVDREERESLYRALGASVATPSPGNGEHALIERRDRTIYLCPLRTELRVLQALVAFRRLLPDDVIDAFVPSREVERAARLLHRLQREQPGVVTHIQQASWFVPLAWFALFDDGERSLRPGSADNAPRLVYATTMTKARARLTRALKPLVELADEPDIAGAVEELRDWLNEFDRDSLVFLDYGGLARTIPFGDLVEDHSAREVWEAISAFEEGDAERSAELYSGLIERWSELRGKESRN